MLIRERETTQRWSSWKWNNSPGVLRLFSKILILGMKVRHSVWLIPPRLTLGQSIYIHNWKDKKWNLILLDKSNISVQSLTSCWHSEQSQSPLVKRYLSRSSLAQHQEWRRPPQTRQRRRAPQWWTPVLPNFLLSSTTKIDTGHCHRLYCTYFWSGRYPLDRAIYRRYMALAKFGNVFMCSMLHCITKMSIAWKKKYLSGWDGPRQVRDGLPRGRQEEWDLLCQQACQVQVQV